MAAQTLREMWIFIFFFRPKERKKEKKKKPFALDMQREAKRTKITLRLWSQEAEGIVKL